MVESKNRRAGIYDLIFHLPMDRLVSVGRLGALRFDLGWYGYVGSGNSGVDARVRRHLRAHERPHWHLDYLLPLGQPTTAVIGHTEDSLECPIARHLEQQFQVVPRFGSSDCRCPGHLFHGKERAPLEVAAVHGMTALGCPAILAPVDWNWNPTEI